MPSLRGVPPGNTLAMPRPARSNHSSPAGSALSICKVWQVEYPWDVRAEKIALALTSAGHHVNLVARNRTSLPEIERLPEATVHRLTSWHWAPGWVCWPQLPPGLLPLPC